MKLLRNKSFIQKIAIVLLALIILNFSMPVRSEAIPVLSTFADISGDLLSEVVKLLASVGDVVMGALNHFMLGTSHMVSSSMLDKEDPNITDYKESSLYAGEGADLSHAVKADIPDDYVFDGLFWSDWKIPNFLYEPGAIFANKIAALDVNFINPNKYQSVENDKDGNPVEDSLSSEKAKSAAGGTLREVIMEWYRGFRNLAVVGLLIVLMYLGIRIMLSSTSSDKAKYKESLGDWLVALCLVAVIHFIMAGILMLVDNFTALIDESSNKEILVEVSDEQAGATGEMEAVGDTTSNGATVNPTVNYSTQSAGGAKFKTNLIGYVRFMAQSEDFGNCTTYTIIYLVLVIYTCVFTFIYFKRFLYMAFFTMIAPLVALTYPIDKARDGKAQAFELWFKEYTMNVIIQPVHLILYTVFVGGAMQLASSNPIYAVVAIGFMIPAEKFIKKMFGVESQTAGGLGDIAGPAMAYAGISKILGAAKGSPKKGKGGSDSEDDSNKALDRGANSDYKTDPTDVLANELPADRDNDPNPPPRGGTQTEPTRQENQQTSTGEGTQTSTGEETQTSTGEGTQTSTENETQTSTGEETQASTGEETQASTGNGTQTLTDNRDALEVDELQADRDARFRAGMASIASERKRKIKRATIDKFYQKGDTRKDVARKVFKAAGKTAVTAGKTAGKVAIRGASMAALSTAGAVAGLAAGVATGDPSKALSYAAGAATLGVGAGNTVGNAIVNKAGQAASSIKEDYEMGAYTKEERKQRQQAEFDKNWKNSEANYKYLRSQGMTDEDAKKFLNDKENGAQQYLNAGITDIKLMHKAENVAAQKGWTKEQKVSRAKMASTLDKNYVKDVKAQNELMENVKKRNSRIDDDMASRFNNDMIDLLK